MLPAAAMRALRLVGCLCTFALVFVSVPALRAQNGQAVAPQTTAAAVPNYDLAAQWTTQKVNRLVFDTSVTPRWLDTGDRFWYAYQTREGRRFFLVDPAEESQGAALRSRQDGSRAHHHHAHSLRRPEPAVQHRPVRQEGHGVRVQLPGAGDRGHSLDQAARDDDRGAAGGDQGRPRGRRRDRRSAAAEKGNGSDADGPAGWAWRTRRGPR